MTLHLQNEVLDGLYLWQYDEPDKILNIFDIPKKTHLLFGIFILDPFIGTQLSKKLSDLQDNLQNFLADWNNCFPWSEYNGIKISQDTIAENGLKYILGQICVEDNVNLEEQLVVTLLRKFQMDYCQMDQVFIKICDTDGDFLMMECHDILPKDFEHPRGNNRLWLYQNQFKLIPNEFCPDRGLKITESLEFLTNNYYKCLNLTKLQIRLDNLFNLNSFPGEQLKKLGQLTLDVEDSKIYAIWKNNPQIMSYLIKNLFRMTEKTSMDDLKCSSDVSRALPVIIGKNHTELLSSFLNLNKSKSENVSILKMATHYLQKSMQSLLNDNVLIINHDITPLSKKSKIFNEFTYDILELSNNKPLSEDDYKPEEEMINLFTKIFDGKDLEDSNENNSETGLTPNDKIPKFEMEFQENDDENGDGSDNGNDNEQEAKDFFKRENIDIDEDDFFEFFMKQALQLKQDDIDQFRFNNEMEKSNENDDNDSNDILNEKEKEALGEMDEYLGTEKTHEELTDAVNQVFQSLSINGSGHNPLESLLRNMSTWKEENDM